MRSSNDSRPDRRERLRGRSRLWVVALLSGAIAAIGLGWNPVAARAAPEEPSGNPLPASADELLARFGQMRGFEARFEEQKQLALLAAPLESAGRLYYAAPSTFLRRVESPSPQDILVTGDLVRIEQAGEVQLIDLAAQREVRPMVESILWIFAGDRAALERDYHLEYQVGRQRDAQVEAEKTAQAEPVTPRAAAGEWLLRLRPKGPPLDRLVRELRLRGRGPGPDTIELIETSGDRTWTRISQARPDRVFDAAERRRLFGGADSARDAP